LAAAKVLDSWALLCYLEQKPGYEKMIELFEKAVESSKPLLMCIVNGCSALIGMVNTNMYLSLPLVVITSSYLMYGSPKVLPYPLTNKAVFNGDPILLYRDNLHHFFRRLRRWPQESKAWYSLR
jgi:hypothetical protein